MTFNVGQSKRAQGVDGALPRLPSSLTYHSHTSVLNEAMGIVMGARGRPATGREGKGGPR